MMEKNGIWVFCENGPQGVREVGYELLGVAARLAKDAGARVVAVALGAGVPVLFFLIRMLANMGGRLEKLKYATVFTLFDPTGLFRGDGAAYAGAAVLLALGLGFYALGTAVFSRRDLPL